MALACIRKSSLNFQVFYDAVDGPLGGGRIKWQFKCRAKPLCALPSFVNGGIIAAWAAVQAHLNQTATTEPLRSRGMSCRAIYQLRLSTSFAAVVTERLQRGMKSPVLDKIPNKRSVEAT